MKTIVRKSLTALPVIVILNLKEGDQRMLVGSKQLLKVAQENSFAVPAVNFIDLDSARSYVEVSDERNLPLILAFAQSHNHILSLEEAALIGKYLIKQSKSPIVLHLDHGEDIEYIKRAIALGFTSVMIDASSKSFDENIRITKEVVNYAHYYGVDVEAELGHVGANDDNEGTLSNSIYTEPNEVKQFYYETGVDSLAISIGTAHGIYKGKPHINFDALLNISNSVDLPLVLHGGSSTGDENLNKCAKEGISKINIFTDLINASFTNIENNSPKNYLEMKELANLGMKDMLHHYYNVFATKEIKI